MFENCRRCGIRKAVAAGLCMLCFGAASVSADVGIAPEVNHAAVAIAAVSPSEAELPHVAEQDFLTHVPGAEIAAGGGTVL